MSTTSIVTTFADIYTEVLNKMRQPTNVAAITAQAKRYVNTALYDIVIGFEYKLPWLERSAFLTLQTPYTTGTVSISQGSTTLTGASTVWTTVNAFGVTNARVGGKIVIAGSTDIYTVIAVNGSVTLTLDNRFIAATVAAVSYTYFEDVYAVASDFLKPIDAQLFSTVLPLEIMGRNDFRRRYPRPSVTGKPRVCTILDQTYAGSVTPVIKIQVYPYPNATYLMPYAYVSRNIAVSSVGVEAETMSADTDEPNIPLRYRHGIVHYAIAQWYRDKKDDARSMSAMSDYSTLIGRLVGDQRIGANITAQVQPRVGSYVSHSRRPYGTRSDSRFSHNNSFDDFRS